jgi:hypothetical protein
MYVVLLRLSLSMKTDPISHDGIVSINQPGENKNDPWLEREVVVDLLLIDAIQPALQEGIQPALRIVREFSLPFGIFLDDDVAYDSESSDTMPELVTPYDSDDDEYVDISRLTVGHTHHQVDRIARGIDDDTRGG